MAIKTLAQPPYSPDLAPCDFCLFPKLRDCRYETIEEMKDCDEGHLTLTQDDFHGAFQKVLERYNKCIAAKWDYFEEDYSFMYVLSIKVPIRKKSGNLFHDLRVCMCMFVCVCVCVHVRIYVRRYNTLTAFLQMVTLLKECLGYNIKQSDSEALVMLELWRMQSTPSLASLPGPLWVALE